MISALIEYFMDPLIALVGLFSLLAFFAGIASWAFSSFFEEVNQKRGRYLSESKRDELKEEYVLHSKLFYQASFLIAFVLISGLIVFYNIFRSIKHLIFWGFFVLIICGILRMTT